jgi:hypothetical protein
VVRPYDGRPTSETSLRDAVSGLNARPEDMRRAAHILETVDAIVRDTLERIGADLSAAEPGGAFLAQSSGPSGFGAQLPGVRSRPARRRSARHRPASNRAGESTDPDRGTGRVLASAPAIVSGRTHSDRLPTTSLDQSKAGLAEHAKMIGAA